MPLQIDHLLYNCAVVVGGGRILGVIPKTYLPTYREFYEQRYFAPAPAARRSDIELFGQRGVPFGNRLIFQVEDQPLFTFHVEVCEDLWVPIPPSSYAALAGATVLLNPRLRTPPSPRPTTAGSWLLGNRRVAWPPISTRQRAQANPRRIW